MVQARCGDVSNCTGVPIGGRISARRAIDVRNLLIDYRLARNRFKLNRLAL